MKTVVATGDAAERVSKFVQRETGVYSPVGAVQTLGFLDQAGRVAGGWLFERYTGPGGSVHAHWAGRPGWITPRTLRMASFYLFVQLGVEVVFGEIKETEPKLRELAERLGFQYLTTLPGYFPDAALCVYSMTKQQCRWLPAQYKDTFHG